MKIVAPKLPVATGIVFRPGSWWVGAHWSKYNKRLCITVIPMITWWLVWEGGKTPHA